MSVTSAGDVIGRRNRGMSTIPLFHLAITPAPAGRLYEGDWLNAMYMTPHDWTPLGRRALRGHIAEPDLSKWDYRHQVLHQRKMKPWRILLNVKWMQLYFHLRPSKLKKIFLERDACGSIRFVG
jgi:hypothetical protein